MARDKVERWLTIQVDGVDLTDDLIPGSLTNAGGKTLEEIEMTGVGDALEKWLSGRGNSEIGADFHLNDGASGAFTKINAVLGTDITVTIQLGSGAAPTTGDPEWTGTYRCMEAPASIDGGKLIISTRFLPAPGYSDHAWGTVT